MAQFELTFLGTGTSLGVPMIGCTCPVCRSTDPRDQRDRSSIYVRTPEMTWVVDTGPDFRRQFLRNGIHQLDAVLITHPHSDHIMGFDDLRPFTFGADARIPVFASPATMDGLRHTFHFAFDGRNRYAGYLKPEPHEITVPFQLGATTITPLPVEHGRVVTTGFRFDRPGMESVAYVPDCKAIPDTTRRLMMDCGILIIDALRYREHPTHLCVEESIAVARSVRAAQTYFTHISHDISHATLSSDLPENIHVAYDGLVLIVE
jgi:phosphoribosyl 1,2-cyclic phosphate phosphodiesterase